MTEDSCVCRGNREGHFGERGVEGLNADDGIALLIQPEGVKQAVDLDVGVGWPHADMVAMLVRDARPFDVELEMYAVAVRADLEELAGGSDRGRVGVLRVVDTLGAGESACREFTCATVSNQRQQPVEATHRDRPSPQDAIRAP